MVEKGEEESKISTVTRHNVMMAENAISWKIVIFSLDWSEMLAKQPSSLVASNEPRGRLLVNLIVVLSRSTSNLSTPAVSKQVDRILTRYSKRGFKAQDLEKVEIDRKGKKKKVKLNCLNSKAQSRLSDITKAQPRSRRSSPSMLLPPTSFNHHQHHKHH